MARNVFGKVGRTIAKPVTSTVQVVKQRNRAVDLNDALQEAADDPKLYTDQRWQTKALTAGVALLKVIPLPRATMSNLMLKIGIIAGSIAAVSGTLLQPETAALLPPKALAVVAGVGSLAATLAALFHPTPEKKAADQPTETAK